MAADTSADRVSRRQGRTVHLLSLGFRPFFLLGGAWAAVAMLLWLAALSGTFEIGGAHGAPAWHAHEMLFGFAAAILAGFLLTAVPGWTRRSKLSEGGLAVLAVVWLAGRVAMTLSGHLGSIAAAVADLPFLILLSAWTLDRVLGGRNWRNLPVAAAPVLLLAANTLFHLETGGLLGGVDGLASRIAIAVYVMLVAVVGGRIVPAFTRNWLHKRDPHGPLPVTANRFDLVVLVLTLPALIAWVAQAGGVAMAGLAAVCALAHGLRLMRWQGARTLREPLLWILHLAYAWVPLSLALVAASALVPAMVPPSAALHALTAGVIATMMLAVMTRATLGHTGRALTADTLTLLAYVLINGAAVARVGASLLSAEALLPISGALWTAAFVLYVTRYGPRLIGPPVRVA